jgi:hypothetical protein
MVVRATKVFLRERRMELRPGHHSTWLHVRARGARCRVLRIVARVFESPFDLLRYLQGVLSTPGPDGGVR